MKHTALIFFIVINTFVYAQPMKTFHDFKTQTLSGESFDLAQLKGKKVLVVNVASECGLTPQYEVLQELFETYEKNNFVIVGFPANNFGGQEPGSNEEIAAFCKKNYGVTFPIMSKISVKGDDMDPIYRWLTNKAENGVSDAEVTWNFQKFLIDENGAWVNSVAPQENPASEEIINWIEKSN